MLSLTWANPQLTTLEAQVTIPVLGEHPVEMGNHRGWWMPSGVTRQFRPSLPCRRGISQI
jgi:hypothetical protein